MNMHMSTLTSCFLLPDTPLKPLQNHQMSTFRFSAFLLCDIIPVRIDYAEGSMGKKVFSARLARFCGIGKKL